MGKSEVIFPSVDLTKNQYHNASQYRLDIWNQLKSSTRQLHLYHSRGNVEKANAFRQKVQASLAYLSSIESYWAFPGCEIFKSLVQLEASADFELLQQKCNRIATALVSGEYRRKHIDLDSKYTLDAERESAIEGGAHAAFERSRKRPYFEVLIVDNISMAQREAQLTTLSSMRRDKDPFTYAPVFVSNFYDAINAISFNHNIQAVIIRFGFSLEAENKTSLTNKYVERIELDGLDETDNSHYGIVLAEAAARLRPELDLYMVTDQSVEDVAGRIGNLCRRVFYNSEDFMELHLNILRGVEKRFRTPFFTALKDYSSRPTGVFHAMPISRGKSIIKSHWIQDMGEFYGLNIFLAETSTTSGGLDSLLEPQGPIKEAQDLAARAFGAKYTFFATNGTSTCNKIVLQALVKPGDIVLVDRDCHKSHHYGAVLSGAKVVYLDSYPLHEYCMYGAVPLRTIKEKLLLLKQDGKLDQVKMLLLTNCTFDGLIYNVERVMEECLAIKPDLIFLWDEAWFAFAGFGPTYRQRTAMHTANRLRAKYRTEEYREEYAEQQQHIAELQQDDSDSNDALNQLLQQRLLPDPDKVRVRVYSTQSTHKTLTALRQGSMIHINDQDYKSKVEESFHEAFMTHTSTSPNYQILASLDVGRRQVELEGYELVQKQVEMALALRTTIKTHPLLRKYFSVLSVSDMIPTEYRPSGIESYCDPDHGWNEAWSAWVNDEFCLDATRITLYIGKTGMDGDTFKNKILMDKYGIQINKTARNSVLFMTNIGTTRSSVAYLIEVLVKIAKELDQSIEEMSGPEFRIHQRNIKSIIEDLPALPDFSHFHRSFQPDPDSKVAEGDPRSAFFLAYDSDKSEYISLDHGEIDKAMATGRDIVSASFIIPYPPGFPILVPGQVASPEIIDFLRNTDVKEIHGYRAELGLRVFTQDALDEASPHKALVASSK